jgi:hypothetical protein
MNDNSAIWTETGEIPEHLLRTKRAYPNKIIDPEEPPQAEIVKAIKYLKQVHLPGSLLGKWQFPLPDIEVFRPPMMFPAPPRPAFGHNEPVGHLY